MGKVAIFDSEGAMRTNYSLNLILSGRVFFTITASTNSNRVANLVFILS